MIKIPVCYGINELERFIADCGDKYICLYLAHKDEAGWDKSTSRVYMNQLWSDFIYIPIDIEKGDDSSLEKLYEIANNDPKIIAINQTQPHKSNPVILELLDAKGQNIDTLVKDDSGRLKALNLNGPSFVEWLKTELNVPDYNYVILGVGGVGEPISRELHKYNPLGLLLVDPVDKSDLSAELQAKYFSSLSEVDEIPRPQVLINAAGKEGADKSDEIAGLLKKYPELIYVDLRPQLSIEEVELAKSLGHKAYTGNGMNARNDYTLVEMIAKKIGQQPPSLEDFQRLVADAS